ncbi:MAG: hypothetical protein JW888_16560 [Pirellulales bacterium]|nr:hypothetical protein [Pirellulales bacterium]
MSLNWRLLRWQSRDVRLITLVGLPVALIYTLCTSEPFGLNVETAGWVWLFVLIHSVLITWRLGRTRNRTFGFLYTQGYTRNALWGHTMLASAASVLAVWLPSAFVIWLGLRSSYQDMLGNCWFPLMGPTEWSYPFWWLLLYAMLLPALHYAWIRYAQPTWGLLSGALLAVGLVVAIMSIWNSVRVLELPEVARWLILGGLATTSISLLIGGWRLHGRLEVMS